MLEVQEGSKRMTQHRVTLTEKHYDLVRRFMVVRKLPNARAATERMIELAASEAAGKGIEGLHNGGDNSDEADERVDRLVSGSRA